MTVATIRNEWSPPPESLSIRLGWEEGGRAGQDGPRREFQSRRANSFTIFTIYQEFLHGGRRRADLMGVVSFLQGQSPHSEAPRGVRHGLR